MSACAKIKYLYWCFILPRANTHTHLSSSHIIQQQYILFQQRFEYHRCSPWNSAVILIIYMKRSQTYIMQNKYSVYTKTIKITKKNFSHFHKKL